MMIDDYDDDFCRVTGKTQPNHGKKSRLKKKYVLHNHGLLIALAKPNR
jgi:hypothetical protein